VHARKFDEIQVGGEIKKPFQKYPGRGSRRSKPTNPQGVLGAEKVEEIFGQKKEREIVNGDD